MGGTTVKRPSITASQMNATATEKVVRFEQLFIPFPRHIYLHEQFDYLNQHGQLSQGRAQKGLRVLAPSNSGKTKAVETYWPAAGLMDTEIRCFHLSESGNAEKEVQPRV